MILLAVPTLRAWISSVPYLDQGMSLRLCWARMDNVSWKFQPANLFGNASSLLIHGS